MTAFTVIGDPEFNRTRFFAAAARAEGADVEVLPYTTVLDPAAAGEWPARLAGRTIKLESPGKDFAVERALLVRGARLAKAKADTSAGAETGFAHVPEERLPKARDPGLLLATRQWYLGWCDLLREIAEAGARGGATFLNAPAEIATMFDKVACHGLLAHAGVPVPPALPPPGSFDELMAALRTAGWSRVFLKASHGSAANGVVALACARGEFQAHTALELAGAGAEVSHDTRLYATRRLRVYREESDVRRLVDALCRERLHIEKWVPKAGLAGRTMDARVVVIGGVACHVMLRLPRGPITNLHLAAEKAGEDLLAQTAGPKAVALLRSTAERAAACFPGSLCVGVDIALTPEFRRAFVLEVNAFGDLLEGVTWRGADTYAWQVRGALGYNWPPE